MVYEKKKFFAVVLTATSAKVDYAIFHLKEKQLLHLQSDFSEVILLCSAVKI